MRNPFAVKHKGEVLYGQEARDWLRSIGWKDSHEEGPRATAVANCSCSWFAPALHGEQAHLLLEEHLSDH